MYSVLTEKEKKKNLFTNIIAREQEVYQYQVNIDNYTALLNVLPTYCPKQLVKYLGLDTSGIVEHVPLEDQQMVSDLIFRNKIEKLLCAEKLEQRKSKYVYDVLISQISPDEFKKINDGE